MKEAAQQLINQLKEFISSIQQGITRKDIEDKRKQLQAINKSIQHLERFNVAIPDDLRNLKTSLVSEVKKGSTMADAQRNQKQNNLFYENI